jgi:hypothetical protein
MAEEVGEQSKVGEAHQQVEEEVRPVVVVLRKEVEGHQQEGDLAEAAFVRLLKEVVAPVAAVCPRQAGVVQQVASESVTQVLVVLLVVLVE